VLYLSYLRIALICEWDFLKRGTLRVRTSTRIVETNNELEHVPNFYIPLETLYTIPILVSTHVTDSHQVGHIKQSYERVQNLEDTNGLIFHTFKDLFKLIS
jgi:hypothetical protein